MQAQLQQFDMTQFVYRCRFSGHWP